MSDIFAADGWLNRVVTASNDFLWTYILIAVLIGCALWFTLRSRGVQFRMIGEMFRLLGESTGKHDGKKHISSFQAFAVSVATRVGTGNSASGRLRAAASAPR